MGVYNPMAKMPRACGECEDRFKCQYSDMTIPRRSDDCPLIEVKAPHGDLIDRNELFKLYEGQRTKYPIKKETPQYETMMMYEVFDEIDDAESVIEAEVE